MGKSLDHSLPDFARRFRPLLKSFLTSASVRRRSSSGRLVGPIYLRRNLPPNEARVRNRRILKVAVKNTPDGTFPRLISNLALVAAKNDRFAVLEFSAFCTDKTESTFTCAPSLMGQLVENGFKVYLDVILIPLWGKSDPKNLVKLSVPRFTSKSLTSLLENDPDEWFTRRLPALANRDSRARFLVSPTLDEPLTFVIRSGDDSSPSVVETSMSDLVLLIESSWMSWLVSGPSRTNRLSKGSSVFSKAVGIAERCSETEFRFRFGEGMNLVRSQRACGRCIFCDDFVGPAPPEMIAHLAFDHEIPQIFSFNFAVHESLLLVDVVNSSLEPMSWTGSRLPRPQHYVHSDTFEALLPYEIDCDTEDEIDESWIHERSDMLLDDFEDVPERERKLMKLWNFHMRKAHYINGGIVTDGRLPKLCADFTASNVNALRPLRRELLVHFFNLWDRGLITKQIIADCLIALDSNGDIL